MCDREVLDGSKSIGKDNPLPHSGTTTRSVRNLLLLMYLIAQPNLKDRTKLFHSRTSDFSWLIARYSKLPNMGTPGTSGKPLNFGMSLELSMWKRSSTWPLLPKQEVHKTS